MNSAWTLYSDHGERLHLFFLALERTRQRDHQSSPAFRTVARGNDTAMCADNGLNKRQPKSMPLGAASLHSLLKHLTTKFLCESRTIIFKD